MNASYKPMLATLVKKPFDDRGWVFETKWDGFRLVAEKRGGEMHHPVYLGLRTDKKATEVVREKPR